jgi:tetratricopeptide (TPR) repeat protein
MIERFAKNWQGLLGAFAIIIATSILYAASLKNGFVGWDDGTLILNNPIITTFTFHSIYQAFTSFDPELYVPLTTITFQLNHLIAGLNPFVFHLTNLVLHITNALLVLWIARLFNLQKTTAFIIALLFAIHPINTEAVAWASARKDVLSALFLLWSIAAYLKYTQEASRRWYIISIALCALGLLSKITVMMLPAILLLIDWYLDRPIDRRALTEKIPHAALSIIFIVIALFGKSVTGTAFIWEKLLMGAKATIFYLLKFFAPYGLSVVYPYTQPISIRTPDILLSVIVSILITALCIGALLRKHWKAPLFAWLWYVLLLLPTFNNAAKGRNELLDIYFASDRYAYVALIGILLLIGFNLDRVIKKFSTATISVVAIIVVILGITTYQQSLVWENTLTLFRHAEIFYPNSYIAHSNIGTELYNQGKIDDALNEYHKALNIRDDSVTWFDVGQIFLVKGQNDKAETAYQNSIKASPLRIEAYLQLGKLLVQEGKIAEARTVFQQAEENVPGNAELEDILEQLK